MDPNRSLPVAVLGSGRSGTSLAARAISLLGVDFGPERSMLEADRTNPRGFWEHFEINRLNDRILATLGGDGGHPPERPPGWEKASELECHRADIEDLAHRYFRNGRWGFKDPRATFTLPLWRLALGEFACVVCIRNPLEVIDSIEAIHPDPPKRSRLYALWAQYTCEAVRQSGECHRAFVFYEDWFDRPRTVVEDMGRFLDGALGRHGEATSSFVDSLAEAELRRQRATEWDLAERDDVPIETRALYFLVRDLATAEERGDVRAKALQALVTKMDSLVQ